MSATRHFFSLAAGLLVATLASIPACTTDEDPEDTVGSTTGDTSATAGTSTASTSDGSAGTTTTTGDPTASSSEGTASDTTGDGTGTDTGAGADLACFQIIDCVSQCADGPCGQACVADGSEEGGAEASALLLCDEANACGGEPTCLDENCPTENLACFTGESSCSQMLDCQDVCADMECVLVCYYESTLDAQGQFDAILECADANSCDDDDACIETNCGDEFAACV